MKKNFVFLFVFLCSFINAQITNYTRIGSNLNGFSVDLGALSPGSADFAYDLETFGDFNNDGIEDILVVDNGTLNELGTVTYGGLWLLTMSADGTVTTVYSLIDELAASLPDLYSAGDGKLYMSATGIGDLNGDGVGDIAVLFPNYLDSDGLQSGALMIAYLNTEAQIIDHYLLINNTNENFLPSYYRRGLANVGDINGDGYDDVTVGNTLRIDSGEMVDTDKQVRLFFIRPNSEEVSWRDYPDFYGADDGSYGSFSFNYEVCGLGDLNGDGWRDIAVGSPHFFRLSTNGQVVYGGQITILFLDNTGEVIAHQDINAEEGGFGGSLEFDDPHFGESIVNFGDIDGDGSHYIAVGSSWDNAQGDRHLGSAWILKLSTAGTVDAEYVLSRAAGNVPFSLIDHDHLFETMTVLDDINNDGRKELVAGTTLMDEEGAIFILEGNFGGLATSLDRLSEETAIIEVYPNPSPAVFHLKTTQHLAEIRLYDVTGRLLLEETLQETNEYQLDLSSYPNGYYWTDCLLSDGTVSQLMLMRLD